MKPSPAQRARERVVRAAMRWWRTPEYRELSSLEDQAKWDAAVTKLAKACAMLQNEQICKRLSRKGRRLRARELEDKLADCRAELEKAKRRSNDMDAQFVRAGRALAEHMRDCCPKCGQRSPIDWCDDDDCPIGSKITESRLAAHAEREGADCWSEGQSHDFVGGKCLRCGKLDREFSFDDDPCPLGASSPDEGKK